MNGKLETLDAENAARSVLAGFATVIPKAADSSVEMTRQLKIAHDSAVTDRSAAMNSMTVMLVGADDTLSRKTNLMKPIKPARHFAALRPRNLEMPADSLRHALRPLARRGQHLDSEAKELRASIEALVIRTELQLLEQIGIGIGTAAEILIVAGDNPERIHSEVAFARLAGISSVPTGSGITSGRHRINHGGHRQLNAAIYRTVIDRMRFHEPTIAYIAAAMLRARASATSSAASSATSSARSATSSRSTPARAKSRVDNCRSVNALMETVNGLFKVERIRTMVFYAGPYRTLAGVEFATAGWVDWARQQAPPRGPRDACPGRARDDPQSGPHPRAPTRKVAAENLGRFSAPRARGHRTPPAAARISFGHARRYPLKPSFTGIIVSVGLPAAIERGRTDLAEPWLFAYDIAAYLRVTKDAVYNWIAEKTMPAQKVGRLWKFQASEIDDWVRRGGAAGGDAL